MTGDARRAGEILLLAAALADREAEVGFGGVDFGGHIVTVKGQARFEPQRIASAEADRFHFFHRAERSEEHTSELQSLMRISYAVFCLKKKKKSQYHTART